MSNQAMLYNVQEYKHIMEHLIAPTRMSNYEKMPDFNEYKQYDCEYDENYDEIDSEYQELNFND